MPPSVKTSKKDIINAALTITRECGADEINARNLAARLGCSTQPIFSNFASMSEVRLATVAAADEIYREYTRRETESGEYPPYKASGMAYIRFAKEEGELFKLLFMRDRSGEEYNDAEAASEVYGLVKNATGLGDGEVPLFHLEMWAVVHGIATMLATNYIELDMPLISRMLTDAYQGLKNRHGVG